MASLPGVSSGQAFSRCTVADLLWSLLPTGRTEKCENRENPGWEQEATVAAPHWKTQDRCLCFLHRGPYGMKGCPELCLPTEENYLEKPPTELHSCLLAGKCLGWYQGAQVARELI